MRIILTLLLAFVMQTSALHAAEKEKFPATIAGDADFSEGDLEKSRQEAKENALRRAVRDALVAEVGSTVVDENAVEVRVRFLNKYEDFVVRSGIVSEAKEGFRLRVVVGYELNTDKLKARIAGAKLILAEAKPRVLVLWAVERYDGERPDLPADKGRSSAYVAASWMGSPTAPAAVALLDETLAANGFAAAPVSAATLAWIRKTLGGEEVSKQFLRDLAARNVADMIVFLRVVERALPTPPAAHTRVTRLHHVAFVVNGATGALRGQPVASAVVNTQDTASLPGREWTNELLGMLIKEKATYAQVQLVGLRSVGEFDEAWAKLRKEFGEAIPAKITGERAAVFVDAGSDKSTLVQRLRTTLPGSTVREEDGRITVDFSGK